MAKMEERNGDEGLWLVIGLYVLSALFLHSPALWLIPAILLVVMLTRRLE